jgi:hypothetical protein
MADRSHRRFASAVALVLVCLAPRWSGAEESAAEELRSELAAMKKQMQEMQKKLEAQGRLLEKLTAERTATPPGASPRAEGVAAPAATAAAPPAPAPPADEQMERRVAESVMRKLQPSLAAANKTFPSQFNPAISVATDFVGSYKDKERGNFELRSAEVGLLASVDPFARAYVFVNGTSDGVELEEAAIVTTSLPWNLTIQGGRFFADFGRLSKWHDHDLPFVNRPIVLDEYVGGESQADGLQMSWLAPTTQYLNITGGFFNKIGSENDRVDNTVPRNLSEFTYLGRASTYFDIADEHGLDVGGSFAWTPNVAVDHGAMRYLAGADVTYRYTPLSEGAYRGLVWGTEVLYNRETLPTEVEPEPAAAAAWRLGRALESGEGDEPPTTVFRREGAVGLYSYLEARLSRRYTPGFLFQFVQELSREEGDTLSYSPYLTVWLSEYQRLRAQYTFLDSPGNHENQIFLQWTWFIGSHAHTFRDR